MKKEFIPYNLALEFKEIGFDEPCLGYYNSGVKTPLEVEYSIPYDHKEYLSAPLYQQTFRWFREKCGLIGLITTFNSKDNFRFAIYAEHIGTEDYNTYEEAELACLAKLIEIVKNK
jgi:hypothetical protein